MRDREASGLLFGTALADFSAWLDFLVIMMLAGYRYQASALVMAIISALILVPGILIGPKVGRWVDRSAPARLLIASLGLRGVSTALLLWAPSLPAFCALVAIRALAMLPTYPASNMLAARLISETGMSRYFARSGFLGSVSKIAAPAIGTGLAARFGESATIMLSVVLTSAAVATLIATLREHILRPHRETSDAEIPGDSATRERTASIETPQRLLLKQLLWTATAYAAMVFFVNDQMPLLLRNAGFGKALFGAFMACSGAGGVLAAGYLSRAVDGKKHDPMLTTTLAVVAVACCFVAFGMAFLLPTSIATYALGTLFFCTGIFGSIRAISTNTLIAQSFPDTAGAVTAKLSAYQKSAILLAPWAAALVIPHTTTSDLFLLDGTAGLLVLLAISAAYRLARRTDMDSADERA